MVIPFSFYFFVIVVEYISGTRGKSINDMCLIVYLGLRSTLAFIK